MRDFIVENAGGIVAWLLGFFFCSLIFYHTVKPSGGFGMEGVYITAIIVGGIFSAIALIGTMVFVSELRKSDGISGLASAKNKAKADLIVNDTQLRIAERNKDAAAIDHD